ncbi:hypothetical protein GNX18_13720 [Microbulbifer sp. SH-1]|uniref:hypothetical protein n=1 Tax=Microbulbifer sp. SH-1 TaxID=2681547 RepID=UPI00140F2F17|nr:hypothetical protein [Microbulbifer sp. SH-1]QIL90703.1 hypothetical protein GNX18_13720 [Microbulbifer sp. SH-1]
MGDVGLGEDFKNTPQVKKAEAGLKLFLKLKLRTSENDTVLFQDTFFLHDVGNNNMANPLFSLGSGWLNMDAICSGGSCDMRFHYSDYFREPLDIKNIEVRGGTPYPINYYYDDSM